MEIKHNHNCQLCNNQRTCFVYKDFSMIFSLCRECYTQLVNRYDSMEDEQDICSFCEKERPCKIIEGFENSTFFIDVRMCRDCIDLITSSVTNFDKRAE